MKFSMRPLIDVSFAVVAVCLATLPAEAQNQGGRGGRGFFGMQNGAKVYLVQAEPVQKELKITDEQKPKLESISQSYRDEMQKLVPFGQGTSREEFRAKLEENRDKLAQLGRDTEKKIDGLLTADQQKRLNEISLQAEGPEALRRDEVASKLKLTDEQKEKIGKVLDEQSEKRRDAFGQGGGGREAFERIREETDKQVAAVLTDEQKSQWKEMQGKEFDLASLRQRRQQ